MSVCPSPVCGSYEGRTVAVAREVWSRACESWTFRAGVYYTEVPMDMNIVHELGGVLCVLCVCCVRVCVKSKVKSIEYRRLRVCVVSCVYRRQIYIVSACPPTNEQSAVSNQRPFQLRRFLTGGPREINKWLLRRRFTRPRPRPPLHSRRPRPVPPPSPRARARPPRPSGWMASRRASSTHRIL